MQGEGDEEEAKRRRQSARGYQKKFHSNHGDAITAVNVLCAFEQSPSPKSFCRCSRPSSLPLPRHPCPSFCPPRHAHTYLHLLLQWLAAVVSSRDVAVIKQPVVKGSNLHCLTAVHTHKAKHECSLSAYIACTSSPSVSVWLPAGLSGGCLPPCNSCCQACMCKSKVSERTHGLPTV